MAKTAVRRSTRSCCHDGREFVIHYELETLAAPEACLIRAYLEEISTDGQGVETPSTRVEVLCPYRELGEKLFDLISNTSEPVFPVHLPEIARDQLSSALLDGFSFVSKASPL
ncbi:MAG: hypothetical protein ACOX35_06880 [Bacillota bacterium]|jgi:hypothetical protein